MAAGPTPAGPGRVFISYRRADSAFPAGWLYDRLCAHLGKALVFKDVDSIEPGDNFVRVIEEAVGFCQVLLALIGDHWLDITDETGRRRLDDPDDFVRLEIEAALRRDVRVIPVLVGHAPMPKSEQLPDSLRGLIQRHAIELSPNRFESDVGRLVRVIDKTLATMRVYESVKAVFDLGEQRQAQGDLTEAAAAYQKAIDSGDPEMAPRAANTLGLLRERQGDLTEAAAAYQKAIDSGHPSWAPRAANLLGLLRERQGGALDFGNPMPGQSGGIGDQRRATPTIPDLSGQLWKSTLASGVLTVMASGVLTVILVLASVGSPGPSRVVVSMSFGLYLLIASITQAFFGFAIRRTAIGSVLLFISSATCLILAVLTCARLGGDWDYFYRPLVINLGIGVMLRGGAPAVAASIDRDLPGRAFYIFLSVVSLIAGSVILGVSFNHGMIVRSIFPGVSLLVIGVCEIAASFQIRNATGRRTVSP
jgi:uncharacterized membrane protein HdeD (DUF308 family)